MSGPPAKRILIYVIAYNAEKTIRSVLDRIPPELRTENCSVLVIDDSSKDATFEAGLRHAASINDLNVVVLRNPQNQGYGGNQKLGYLYAIENGYDIVAMVHGDGQYAPEKLPMLLQPLINDEADVVFGSRMLQKKDALKGGMPFYKWIANQVLTKFQNLVVGTKLSEFHSGYRLYSTKALRRIPFERNANDFHFDTDIIIQLHLAGLTIKELPIPTFYGDEVCHVNGLRYAWDICKSTLRARFHESNLLYDRKFDVGQPEFNYDLKLGYRSSHTMALDAVKPGASILDIGCGQGDVAALMTEKGAEVTGVDQYASSRTHPKITFKQWNLDSGELPVEVSRFDQIFLLDIIEHLKDPEDFMERLRAATGSKRPEIVLTTANIGFAVTRFALLLGQFNYGRKGILDRTHTRLFTFRTLRELFHQTGYKVTETRGIPAPFPKALGMNFLGKGLLWLNQVGISLLPGLFSYQIFIRAEACPTIEHLLVETIGASEKLRGELPMATAR